MIAWALMALVALSGCGGDGGGGDSAAMPPPAPAPAAAPVPVLLHWTLTGTLADGGTISGALAYDPAATPTATNIHNLHPNASYPVTEIAITLHSTLTAIVPDGTMLPGEHGAVEFCIGQCIFAGGMLTRVYVTNGLQSVQLAFIPPPVPVTGLPTTVQEWGTLEPAGSHLDSFDALGNFQVRDGITAVHIAAVPVP